MDPKRKLTRRFTRDLIAVLLVLFLAVMGPVVYFSLQAKRDISEKFIDGAASRAVAEFQFMAETMNRNIEMVRDWCASGKTSLADTGGLNGLLFPLLKRDRLLFGISVADTHGNSYYVATEGDGWRTSETQTGESGRFSKSRFWDAGQQQVAEEKEPSQYDPRQRPWFLPALSAKTVFWTEPYVFYSRNNVGVTASISSGQASDDTQTVIAFDILLDDLFREIKRLAPSPNSRVFIFRRDARLYMPDTSSTIPDFKSMDEVKDQLIQKMVASWMSREQDAGHVFSLRHDGGIWWGGFRPLENANRNTWVGVMVPEADITGGVTRRQTVLWVVGLLVMLVAGGLSFWMVRRYDRAFDNYADLYDHASPEASIRRLIGIGEGRAIEFKSTMRMNLHTGKAGKEIEMAWLKAVAAFMNTDGGILLIGVTNSGEINGLEDDRFENEDKCMLHFKNLISQHIGAELSKYLHFSIVCVDEKTVGVVVCNRSAEPAFLKTPKSEAFFIRNGPSSDELPISKVLTYIKHRK